MGKKDDYTIDISGILSEVKNLRNEFDETVVSGKKLNNTKIKPKVDTSQIAKADKIIKSLSMLDGQSIDIKVRADIPKETITDVMAQGSKLRNILQKIFGNKTKYDWNTVSVFPEIPKELSKQEMQDVTRWINDIKRKYVDAGKDFTEEIEKSYKEQFIKMRSLRSGIETLGDLIRSNEKVNLSEALRVDDTVLTSQATAINNMYKLRKLYIEINSSLGEYSIHPVNFEKKNRIRNTEELEEDYKKQKNDLAKHLMNDIGFTNVLDSLSLGSFNTSGLTHVTAMISKYADAQAKAADKIIKKTNAMIAVAQKYKDVTQDKARSELHRLFSSKPDTFTDEMKNSQMQKFIGNYYAYKRQGGKPIQKYEDWWDALAKKPYTDADNKDINPGYVLVQALDKVFSEAATDKNKLTDIAQLDDAGSAINKQTKEIRDNIKSTEKAAGQAVSTISRYEKQIAYMDEQISNAINHKEAKKLFLAAYDDLGKYTWQGTDEDPYTDIGISAELFYWKSYKALLDTGSKANMSKYTYPEVSKTLLKDIDLDRRIEELENRLSLFSSVLEYIHSIDKSYLSNNDALYSVNKLLTFVVRINDEVADISNWGTSFYNKEDFQFLLDKALTEQGFIQAQLQSKVDVPVTFNVVPYINVDQLWAEVSEEAGNFIEDCEKELEKKLEEKAEKKINDTINAAPRLTKKKDAPNSKPTKQKSDKRQSTQNQYAIEKAKLDELLALEAENDSALAALERKKQNYAQEVYGENKRVVDSTLLNSAIKELENIELPIMSQKRASQKAWDDTQSVLKDIIQKYFIGQYGLFNSPTLDIERYMKTWIASYQQSVKGNSLKSLQLSVRGVLRDLNSYVRGVQQSRNSNDIIVTDVLKQLEEEEERLFATKVDLYNKIDHQRSVVNELNPNSLDNILKNGAQSSKKSSKTQKDHSVSTNPALEVQKFVQEVENIDGYDKHLFADVFNQYVSKISENKLTFDTAIENFKSYIIEQLDFNKKRGEQIQIFIESAKEYVRAYGFTTSNTPNNIFGSLVRAISETKDLNSMNAAIALDTLYAKLEQFEEEQQIAYAAKVHKDNVLPEKEVSTVVEQASEDISQQVEDIIDEQIEEEIQEQTDAKLRKLRLGSNSNRRYTNTDRRLGKKTYTPHVNIPSTNTPSTIPPVNTPSQPPVVPTTPPPSQPPQNSTNPTTSKKDLDIRKVVEGNIKSERTYIDSLGRTVTIGQRLNKKTQSMEPFFSEITNFIELENEAVKTTNALNLAVVELNNELRKPAAKQSSDVIDALNYQIDYYEQRLNAIDYRAKQLAQNDVDYTFDLYQKNVNTKTTANDLALLVKDAKELRKINDENNKAIEKEQKEINQTNTFLTKQCEIVKNIQELYDPNINPHADKPIKNTTDLQTLRTSATKLLDLIDSHKDTIISSAEKDSIVSQIGDFKRAYSRLTKKEYKATTLSPNELSVNKRMLQNEYQTFIESASVYGEEAAAIITDAKQIQDSINKITDATDVWNKTGELKVLRERLKVVKAKKQVSDKHKRDTLLGEKATNLADQITEFYTELEEIGKLSDSVKQQLESMFDALISAETTTDVSIVKEKFRKLVLSKDTLPFEDYGKVWNQWLAIIDKNNAPQYFTDEALGIDHPDSSLLPTANNSALNDYAKMISEQANAYLGKYKELNSLYKKLATELRKQDKDSNYDSKIIENIKADIDRVIQEKNNLGSYQDVIANNKDIISESIYNDIESARQSMYQSKNAAENTPKQLAKEKSDRQVTTDYQAQIDKVNELILCYDKLAKFQKKQVSNPFQDYTTYIDDLKIKIEGLESDIQSFLQSGFISKNVNIIDPDDFFSSYEKYINIKDGYNDDLISAMQKVYTAYTASDLSILNMFSKSNIDVNKLTKQQDISENLKSSFEYLKKEVEEVFGADVANKALSGTKNLFSQQLDTIINNNNLNINKEINTFLKSFHGSGAVTQSITSLFQGLSEDMRNIGSQYQNGSIDIETYTQKVMQCFAQIQQYKDTATSGIWKNALDSEGLLDTLSSVEKASDKIPAYAQKIQDFYSDIIKVMNSGDTDSDVQMQKILNDIKEFQQNAKAYTKTTSGGTLVQETVGKISDFNDVKNGLREYAASLGYTKEVTGSATKDVDSMSMKFRDTNGNVLTLKGSIENFNNSLRVTESIANGAGGFIGHLGVTFKELGSVLTTYFSIRDIFQSLVRGFQSGWEALQIYDAAMTNMSYTMDLTQEEFRELGLSAVEMADNLSMSLDNAMEIYAIYANMQTTPEQINEIAKPTAILSNLAGIETGTASDQIQGVLQQFNMIKDDADDAAEASMHVVDVLDHISANVSIDNVKAMGIMSDAIQAAGQVAYDAGLSYEQLAAISAKVSERTREDGSTIGNAMKTIITRISKVGKMPAYAEEVSNADLSNASASLHEVGVEVYNADGSFRELDVILGELEDKWDGLTDAQKSNISYNVAATRQTSKFKNMIEAWTESMELAESATLAHGNALANQEKYEDSYTGKITKIKTQWDEFWLVLLNSDQTKDVLDFVSGLTARLIDLEKAIGPIPTAIAGIIALISGKTGFSALKDFILGDGIKNAVS